jgi:hypothetical protein
MREPAMSFTCPVCGMLVNTDWTMNHFVTVHNLRSFHWCSWGYRAVSVQDLADHLRTNARECFLIHELGNRV